MNEYTDSRAALAQDSVQRSKSLERYAHLSGWKLERSPQWRADDPATHLCRIVHQDGPVLFTGGAANAYEMTLDDVEIHLADASGFDVHFDGGATRAPSTTLPSLIYMAPGALPHVRYACWWLLGDDGHEALLTGNRDELDTVAVEARRILTAWRSERLS